MPLPLDVCRCQGVGCPTAPDCARYTERFSRALHTPVIDTLIDAGKPCEFFMIALKAPQASERSVKDVYPITPN